MAMLLGGKANQYHLMIDEIRREVKRLSIPGRYRLTAEILLNDGSRWIYRAKAIDQDHALNEVLTFVEAIERNTGESVVWRLRGENTYRMGVNVAFKKPSLIDRIIEYFFGPDLE